MADCTRLASPDERQHCAEPLQTRPPARSATGDARLGPLPSSIDLGEQIVGSDHWYEIALLEVVDGFAGNAAVTTWCETYGSTSSATVALAASLGLDEQAVAAVEDREARALLGEIRPQIEPGDRLQPLRVRYAPLRPGASAATVRYRIHWTDGRTSEGSVMVRARARHLDAAPSTPLAEGPMPVGPAGELAAPTDAVAEDFDTAKSRAGNNAAKLADAQEAGVKLAEDEARSYQKAAPKASWWSALAEIAISMGVAGVAGVVAKQLASSLGRLEAVSHAASALERKGVSTAMIKDLGGGVTDSIKDGLKTSAKQAIAAAHSASSANRRDGGTHRQPDPISSNPTIDFWARQRLMLTDVSARNREMITNTSKQLTPLLGSNPSAAISIMGSVARSLAAVGTRDAALLQTLASEAQWVAGISQANHGVEQVETTDGKRTVTDLRPSRTGLHRASDDGLLHIEVEIPSHSGESSQDRAVVKRAKLLGVSSEIVAQLHRAPLAAIGLPMMITVRGGSVRAIITRDEIGRVRVEGKLPLGEPVDATSGEGEPMQIAAATRLVNTVLAQDLKSHIALDQFQHDDATENGDQR